MRSGDSEEGLSSAAEGTFSHLASSFLAVHTCSQGIGRGW